MTRRLSLEEFDGAPPKAPAQREPEREPSIDADAIRSSAYEDGYKSGWDDCHAEHLKSEEAIASDLARNLQDMELTYREARGDVLAAIKPVLDTIIDQVLPKIASEGLSAMVAQELMPHLSDASDLRPELQCAPNLAPVLQKLMERRADISVVIKPEPEFSGAQVALRLGAEARNIDLTGALEQIGQELGAFTERLISDLPSSKKG